MGFPFAEVIGGIGSFGASLLGKDSQDDAFAANQANLNEIKGLYGVPDLASIYGLQEEGFAKQNEYLQQALGITQSMQGGIANLGGAATQRVLDREQERLGALDSSLTSRGLGSTTVGANLARGIYADTDRALQDIDEMLAGLSLGVQQQEVAGVTNLANAAGAQTGAQTNTLSQLAQILSGVQHVGSGPVDLGGLVSGVSSALGSIFNDDEDK